VETGTTNEAARIATKLSSLKDAANETSVPEGALALVILAQRKQSTLPFWSHVAP